MKLTVRQLKNIIREAITAAEPRKPMGAPPSKYAYIIMYKGEPLAVFTDPKLAREGNETISAALPLAGGSIKKVPLDLIEDQMYDLVNKIKDTGSWAAEKGSSDLYW